MRRLTRRNGIGGRIGRNKGYIKTMEAAEEEEARYEEAHLEAIHPDEVVVQEAERL